MSRHLLRFSFLVTLLLAASAARAGTAQTLAERLTAGLERPPLDRNLWGVAVLDGSGRLVWGHNAERMFTPASNTKLLVTATALALLGPDWTVRTSVHAAGPVASGVVFGDLVLYGRGDPTWTHRCYAVDTLAPGICDADAMAPLARLAGQLRARGIRAVQGDVVGDGSWFEAAAVHPNWENDDLPRGYAAPVSGLGFHENTVTLTVTPGPVGSPPFVTLEPLLPEVELAVHGQTVPAGTPTRLDVERDGWRVIVVGTIGARAEPRLLHVAVPDGNRYAAAALRQALADSGIRVSGGTRGTADSALYPLARLEPPLAEIDSRPLRDWVFPVLNVSQNWYAEMLLKQLGRARGMAGTWAEGLRVQRRFLVDVVGIDSTQFLLDDGSGLSSRNLVSPMALARLLAYMRTHPHFGAFAAGIPRGGELGTLRNRFTEPDLRGVVRAKTGSIAQVNTLSGYIEPVPGAEQVGLPPRLVFSIQANHHTLGGRAMIQAIDSLVAELARAPAGHP